MPGARLFLLPNVRHDAESTLARTRSFDSRSCASAIFQMQSSPSIAQIRPFWAGILEAISCQQRRITVMYVPKPGWYEIILRSHDSITGKLDEEMRKAGSRASLMDAAFDFHNHELARSRFMEQQERMREAFHQLTSFDEVSRSRKTFRQCCFIKHRRGIYLRLFEILRSNVSVRGTTLLAAWKSC